MAKQQQKASDRQVSRLPLIGAYSNRSSSGTKDQRFVNMFPETKKVESLESTKIYINKRPGLELYKSISTGEGRGLLYFNSKFYAAIGNTVYEVTDSTTTSKITMTTSTGNVGMIIGNSILIGDYLFVCDGIGGWVIKTDGTVTQITDVDFPTPHHPVPTFIDGYIILSKGSDVYNCIVDTPTSWDPSNYLTAEMFPDAVVSLARQNNQVVVMGNSSIEFFYDAANVSGSPLTRNDSTTIQMGCAAPHAVYQNEKFTIYVAQSDSGGRGIWIIDGFQPKKISDEYIDRVLDTETSMSTCRGFGVRSMGHLFYVVNLKGIGRTFVYDLEEKMWHEWSANNSSTHAVFGCDYMTDRGTGMAYMLHATNGKMYKFNPTVYVDDGTAILSEIVTNKYDFDSYNRKFLHSVKLVGDEYSSTNDVTLRWTDTDYKSWSNYKTISLVDGFPAFHRLGAFRRRAFNLLHTADQPLRLESLECNYTIGDY